MEGIGRGTVEKENGIGRETFEMEGEGGGETEWRLRGMGRRRKIGGKEEVMLGW